MQELARLRATQKDVVDEIKRKATVAVQAAHKQARKNVEDAKAETQNQLKEAQQTLANLRDRIANLELELTATQDRVNALTKEKTWAMEWAAKLEQQRNEYLNPWKTFANTNESLIHGGNAPAATTATIDEINRLQQE